MTAKFFVVNLQILSTAAVLASPSVSLQDLSTELSIRIGLPSHTFLLYANAIHRAFWLTCVRKTFCCSVGRNLKKASIDLSSISGVPFSRFAPARKSAQIISKQYPRDLSLPSISAAVSIA